MQLSDLRDIAVLEDFDRQWGALSQLDSLVFETRHRRKDGTTFPVEVSARRIAVEGLEFRQAIIRDTTERSKLQEQLQQSQKMESIGRLAGGVAHDFNNILTVITGYTSFVLEALRDDDPLRGPINEIQGAGQRAASLTHQLLAFSRKQVIDPKLINLNDTILDVCKMLQRLVGEDIDVVSTLDPNVGRILADPNQIQQVLMNLAANARDAMPNGGTLMIETHNVEIGEAYVAAHAGTAAGPYVLLTVTDTGLGMDDAVRRQIFEPFFTTKPQGQGTGLGLAMVYGTVKQSGGWIWVYSEPGRGTTFKIYLPRSSGEGESDANPPVQVAVDLRGSETLLIVEDQHDVRRLAVQILERRGYRVLQAATPSEALQLCQSTYERIDLLITDVVMPGMNGRDLAVQLLAQRPSVKVLYMSGYTENIIGHQGILDRGVAYISKPFTPVALAEKVREVLA
jgi:signal transduction histidine kinase